MLFYAPDISPANPVLPPDEVRHAVKVLRLQRGDGVEILDGRGTVYAARIAHNDGTVEITGQKFSPKPVASVHIAIAPTKNIDRMEWFLEKVVEIGVSKVTMLVTNKSERRSINHERLEKVIVSAMKQSRQSWLPEFGELRSFRDFIKSIPQGSQNFIAHVDQLNPLHLKDAATRGRDVLVLIGPEGDFSDDELAAALSQGFQKVSLGQSRLRTETAGIVACHILNLINS